MPDCPASGQSGTGMNKNTEPETVRYRNKGTRPGTGMLQYRTEVPGAGMPIPAASPAKLTDGLQRFRTDSFCLPSKLRTRHKRFMIVVFL